MTIYKQARSKVRTVQKQLQDIQENMLVVVDTYKEDHPGIAYYTMQMVSTMADAHTFCETLLKMLTGEIPEVELPEDAKDGSTASNASSEDDS